MSKVSITIRNLVDGVKTRLLVRAPDNGRSMEEWARLIRRDIVKCKNAQGNLVAARHARIASFGGVDLDLPPCGPMREPPSFE